MLRRALEIVGITSYFQPQNDLEVSGRKIAGLSAAAEADTCLLFHTSLLVDFDIGLMTDIMSTPVIKLAVEGRVQFDGATVISKSTDSLAKVSINGEVCLLYP